ncbi:unnamed protein product [Pseudo-nitzschia multistriata]|uniref:Abscisic acid G-protein coupled receptor-like domain-containing protein n=1 Tax=Pseudo-nitzschia multistriata TaxID=183589 RepID=A0A448ZD27_9STRA|nr:unnamed protein product [Pseudo-nitzschia multistriata]
MDSSSHKDNEKEYSQVQLRSARQYFFAILGGSCGIMYTLKILSTIGPLVVQPPSEYETNIISLVVSWICALGLLISAVLNGFGSVSLPYANLCGFFLQVRPDYITNLESELKSIESALSKKRRMEKELKVEIPSLSPSKATNRTGSSSNAFSMSSILTLKTTSNGFSELGDELRIRRQILQTEISFMEDLLRETKLDLEELKESQVTAAAARSSMGKNKSYVGILFSVILLVRLLIAGFSIFRSYGTLLTKGYASDHHRHKKPHSDIVTIILLWLTGHNYFSHNQYAMISQMVSLILSAVLSFSQVRLFLRNATIVHRRLSRFSKKCFNGGGAMDGVGSSAKDSLDRKSTVRILWPIISAFLGCYSLACIVLIKMMLPKRFSVAFSKAMGEKGIFTIHSSMVDMVFFSSAVLSAGILGMLLGIQRQNISRHANILTQRGGNVAGNTLPDV